MTTTIQPMLRGLGDDARTAAQALATMPTATKAAALRAAAAAIREDAARILAANAQDIAAAEGNGLSGAMLDRLRLDPARVEAMAVGVDAVAGLRDPVGGVIDRSERPNGLALSRVRVPIGVIGIIYESRPNVTADAGALAVMAGNAAILRGGSEAIRSNRAIPASRRALEKAGWSVEDLDLVEANEAFAAQALAVCKDMGWTDDKVNVNGGAIAIGHPTGASGARVLTTLLYEMKRRDAKKGLATLCIGGGMGIAMCVER